jgi:trans-2,3-dihydro-3-hydroxyanthranilate isomerase
MRTYDPEKIMPLFGLEADDALPGAPIQTVNTGTPMLMIPLRDHSALRRAELHVSKYLALKEQSDFFSPHLFCNVGLTEDTDTFARHFGVPPDTYEDPFTGSASGCMAAYLWHYGLIKRPWIIAGQGHWMGRPGKARLEVVGTPEDIQTVKLIEINGRSKLLQCRISFRIALFGPSSRTANTGPSSNIFIPLMPVF